MTTPWIAVGQTQLAAGIGIDDPAPNYIPAIAGSVQALPFLVPEGKKLILEAWGMESYDAAGVCVNVPWVESPGDPGCPAAPADAAYRKPRCLHSVASDSGSHETLGCQVEIGAGAKLHGRLINGSSYAGVYGWYMKGRLEDAE